MHFIWFIVRVVLADFVALIIVSIGTLLAALPLYPASLLENRVPKIVYKSAMYICSIPMLIFMLLFWGFWAAYNVGITYLFANSSTGIFNWVYWIINIISCITFLSWLAYKEKQNIAREYFDKYNTARDQFEQRDVIIKQIGEERTVNPATFGWQIYTFIVYVIFALYPHLMLEIYRPALEFLGAV